MITITQLYNFVAENFPASIQTKENELLFTIGMTNGRRQTVIVSLFNERELQVIEVKSRCCHVTTATLVRTALRRNLFTSLGGLAMDITQEPPALDFVQRLVVPSNVGINYPELLNTISVVALQADLIEQKMSKDDVF